MRVDEGGRTAPVRIMTDQEEMAELKRYSAQMRREQAAAQRKREQEGAASTRTQQARQSADTALTEYNNSVRADQDRWASEHAGQFSSQAAAQAAWQRDWENSQAGKEAWAKLAPHLQAYDQAAADELRVTAENAGGNVSGAVAQKADQIRGLQTDGGWNDEVLDGRITALEPVILGESPATRRTAMAADDWTIANDKLTYAEGELAKAQQANSGTTIEYWNTQVNLARAEVNALTETFAGALGYEFDGEAATILGVSPEQVPEAMTGMTDDQFNQVIQKLKANHGNDPTLSLWIDLVGDARRFDRDVTAKVAEVQTALRDIGNNLGELTPLERKMWDEGDRTTLAFLKLAGFDFGPGNTISLTVDGKTTPITLSEIEQKLILSDEDHDPDLRLLSLLLLGDIRITEFQGPDGKPMAEVRIDGDLLLPLQGGGWIRVREFEDGQRIPVQQDDKGQWVPAMQQQDGRWVFVQKNQDGQWVPAQRNGEGAWVPVEGGVPNPALRGLDSGTINNQALQQAATDASGKALSQLGYSLMPHIELTPDLKILMAAASVLRPQDTRQQVAALMDAGDEAGAMRVLTSNMDAAFAPEERQRIWQDVGLSFFGRQFILDHIHELIARPNSDPSVTDPDTLSARQDSTTYADKVGRWMQTILEDAPPEFVNLVLDVVQQEFRGDWGQSNSGVPTVGRGLDFYKGLTRAVELVPDRADDVAIWLTDWEGEAAWVIPALHQEGFLITVRSTISDGHGAALSKAIADKLARTDGEGARYSEFQQAVDIGIEEWGQDQAAVTNRLQFEDFEANRNRIVNPFFEHVLNGPMNVTEFQDINGQGGEYWLENFIGTSHGWTPDNVAAAQAGDHSQRWFTNTQYQMQIDLIAGWIRDESKDDWKIRAIPVIYASERDGYTYGALFQLESPDGEDEVLIDGLVAPQIAATAIGNPNITGDDKAPETDALPHKYDSLRNFQDDNHLSEDGRIYLPYDMVADLDPHGLERFEGNAEIGVIDAARYTGWERTKFVGSLVLLPVAIIAAPFTGMQSLWLSVPAWTAIGLGAAWGVGVTVDELTRMSSHGQTLSLSNPQARSAWIGLVGSVAGVASSGLSIASKFGGLARVGGLGTFGAGIERNAPLIVRGSDFLGITTGGYLTIEQGGSLLNNWARMSDREKREGIMMFLVGLAQLSYGAWGLRHPMGLPAPRVKGTEGGDLALYQDQSQATYWAHRSADGSRLVMQLMPDGSMVPVDGNGSFVENGPARITLFETSEGPNGSVVPENMHLMLRGQDGAYRVTRVAPDGTVWADADAPGSGGRPADGDFGDVYAPPPARTGPLGFSSYRPVPFRELPAGTGRSNPGGTLPTGEGPPITQTGGDHANVPVSNGSGKPVSAPVVPGDVAPPTISLTAVDMVGAASTFTEGSGASPVPLGQSDDVRSLTTASTAESPVATGEDPITLLPAATGRYPLQASSGEHLRLAARILDIDDAFLAAMAGNRRPQIRTASEAVYVVPDHVLEANYAGYYADGAPHLNPGDVGAYVAYGQDGEARAIFFRDDLGYAPAGYRNLTIAHEIAHYYGHPKFLEVASALRVDPKAPHSELSEGAAEYLAQSIVGGHTASDGQGRYAAETRVVADIVARMGGDEAFYKAYFKGDQDAIDAFYDHAEDILGAAPATGAPPPSSRLPHPASGYPDNFVLVDAANVVDPSHIVIEGSRLTPHEVLFRSGLWNSDQQGQSIVLMADGTPEHFTAFAQTLANTANTEVFVSDKSGQVPWQSFTPQASAPKGTVEFTDGNVVLTAADGSRRIVAPEEVVGGLVATGSDKSLFEFGDKVVAIWGDGDLADAQGEVTLLDRLRNTGLPTLKASGPLELFGRPALIYDRYVAGSKEISFLDRGGYVDDTLLNQNSVDDLNLIRQTLVDQHIGIWDLQLLVAADGHVVVADPLGADFRAGPSQGDLRLIDAFIAAAESKVARGDSGTGTTAQTRYTDGPSWGMPSPRPISGGVPGAGAGDPATVFAQGSQPDRLTLIASASKQDMDAILGQPGVATVINQHGPQAARDVTAAIVRRSDELNGTPLRTDAFYTDLGAFAVSDANLLPGRLTALRLGTGDIDGVGAFGPILRPGNYADQALRLDALQGGEIPEVANHPQLGAIALPWGDASQTSQWRSGKGFGLTRMAQFRPDAAATFPALLSGATVAKPVATKQMGQGHQVETVGLKSGPYSINLIRDPNVQTSHNNWIVTTVSARGQARAPARTEIPQIFAPATAAQPPATPAGNPQPGFSGAGATAYSTTLWPTYQARLQGGFVNPPTDKYVYVVKVPTLGSGSLVRFDAADIVAYGLMPKGGNGIDWLHGTTPVEAPRTVNEQFGEAPSGFRYAFVIADEPPSQVTSTGGHIQVTVQRDPSQIPGPGGQPYQPPRHGEIMLGAPDAERSTARGFRAFGLAKLTWDHLAGDTTPEEGRYVSEHVATLIGKAAIPMQWDAIGLFVADPHNHPNIFSHPHYIDLKTFVQTLFSGKQQTQGIISGTDLKIIISAELIPYLTRANAGAWQTYHSMDVAEVSSRFAHRDDWKMLRQYETLPDDLRKHVIPSITGIETYTVSDPSQYGSGGGPREYIDETLLMFPDIDPMAGEINGDKEVKSQKDGRIHTHRPMRSDELGETGTTVNDTLYNVLDELRDAQILTVLHSDTGRLELGKDGLPIRAPSDSRYTFPLAKMFMRLGGYDLSGINFNDPNFTLTNADIASITSATPTRPAALLIHAHWGGIGNYVRGLPHQIDYLQWFVQHPLLEHIYLDSSWMPAIEAMMQNPKYRARIIELIKTGRIVYAGDATNYQTVGQLGAPWFAQQTILKPLERQDPAALVKYASGTFLDLYARSQPGIQWRRYRAYNNPENQQFIQNMPEDRRAKLDNWIANYERVHPEVLNGQTPHILSLTHGLSTHATLPRQTLSNPDLANAVHITAVQGKSGPIPFEDAAGFTVSDSRVWDRSPASPNIGVPRRPETVANYLRKPAFTRAQLETLRTPEGKPFAPEAIDAAAMANEVGANRGLQLVALLSVDYVQTRQEVANARIQGEGDKQVKSILLTLGVVALTVTGGGIALNNAGLINPHVTAAALAERGVSIPFRTGNQQLFRKLGEGIQEEGIVTPEMIAFMRDRIQKYGPQMGLLPERLEGPNSVREELEQALVDLAYMLNTPVNTPDGETNDMRHAIVQAVGTGVIPKVDSQAGAAWNAFEPGNFRTTPGRVVSFITALAYEAGVFGSINLMAENPAYLDGVAQVLANIAFGAFIAGNSTFGLYHMTGAVSGRFKANWAELPPMRRAMNFVGWPAIALGNMNYAAAELMSGHYPEAGFAGLIAGAATFLAGSGVRAETGWNVFKPFSKPGESPGVYKPRRVPTAQIVAAAGLIGLAATHFLRELMELLDERNQQQSPQGPARTPAPIVSPSSTSSPPGSSPTPTSATPSSPAPSTGSSSGPRPTAVPQTP